MRKYEKEYNSNECHACLTFTDDITLYLLKATRAERGFKYAYTFKKGRSSFFFQTLQHNVYNSV